tara:strand:+ start:167 stop:757 length:591 start_codon:yes stop_codon:yes gene_type:complete
MKYFHLLKFLPLDLIHYIYYINTVNSANIIIKKYRFYKKVIYVIKNVKNFILNDDIVSDYIINSFNFIINNTFPNKYNKLFWEHLLNLISNKLGTFNVYFIILALNNNFKKNDIKYKNFEIAINLWLKMCQKYDISFTVFTSKNFSNISKKYQQVTIKSRNLIKLKNFNKFIHRPAIYINNKNESIQTNWHYINSI